MNALLNAPPPSPDYLERYRVRSELADLTGDYYPANVDILELLKGEMRKYNDPKIITFCLTEIRRIYGHR